MAVRDESMGNACIKYIIPHERDPGGRLIGESANAVVCRVHRAEAVGQMFPHSIEGPQKRTKVDVGVARTDSVSSGAAQTSNGIRSMPN